ncbi:MAG: chromosome segregation protein SMC, partial [Clostridia bacterium]|nr:chromosome segregation protein SMC [Clostridia bacterium]
VKKLQNKSQDLSSQLENANNSFAEVSADITALKADLTTANEDKIRALAELRRLEDLISTANQNIANIENEENLSAEKLAMLISKAEESSKKISELEIKKTELQAEIDSMTGGRDSLSAKRESLGDEITSVKLSIIETEKDIESLTSAKTTIVNLISTREKRVLEIDNEIKDLQLANTQLEASINDTNAEISRLKQSIADAEKNIEDMLDKRNNTEKSGVELRAGEREKTAKREQIGGELARLVERKEVMMREYDEVIAKLFDEYQLTRSEAEALGIEIENLTEAKKLLTEIKHKIRALGNVNVAAIEEYKEVSERYEFLSAQVEDIEKTRSELYKLINQLTTQMKDIFTVGFEKISNNFSKTFVELFGGGSASLSLSDPENILESGIDINVKLPGKNVPSLDGLSGGEKALIALSIYFSIMRVNAPPFCFLDEVDTALDDINVERFANYMKDSEFATQFICVTHRRGTMEAADMLYGVTMQEKGVTKLLELNVSELEKKLELTETA